MRRQSSKRRVRGKANGFKVGHGGGLERDILVPLQYGVSSTAPDILETRTNFETQNALAFPTTWSPQAGEITQTQPG